MRLRNLLPDLILFASRVLGWMTIWAGAIIGFVIAFAGILYIDKLRKDDDA